MLAELTLAVSLATPAFFMLAGVLVFALRPGGTVNQVAGAFLFLSGAADLMWFSMWHGPADTAFRFARLGIWYDVGRMFCLFLLLHVLYPPRRAALWRGIALGGLGVALSIYLFVLVMEPTLAVVSFRSFAPNVPQWGPLWSFTAALTWGGLALAVAASAVVASSTRRSVVERRQAATVAAAFLVVAVYTGFQEMVAWPRWLLGISDWRMELLIPLSASVSLLGVSVFAAPRVLGALEPGVRGVFAVILVLAVLASVPFPVWAVTDHYWDVGRPDGWAGIRRFVAMFSAALLVFAFMRYGLAGFAAPARRRITVLAHVSLLVVVFLLPAAILLFFMDGGNVVVVAGVFTLVAMGTTFAPVPLRTLRSGIERLFLLDPRGDPASAERARRYRTALEHRAAHKGDISDPDDPVLSRLRTDLGLGEDDHVRIAGLLETGGSRDSFLLGRYQVVRELGRGAFAVALLAIDESTGREVVLKRYHRRDLKENALKEARLLSRVKHPRVIPLLAVEETHNEVFLVMPHAVGGSLQDLMDREGALELQRTVRLVLDLLEALGAMHAAGLAHRDVKPGNLLLDSEGRVLLGDLGATRVLVREDRGGTLTVSPLVGSFATAAPEALRGERAGPQADVYAAGAVLFKLLTKEDYVDLGSGSTVKMMHAVLHGPVRLPHPGVPTRLEAVLRRALEKDPKARYANGREMGNDLLGRSGAAGDAADSTG